MNIAVVEDNRQEAQQLRRFLEQYEKERSCEMTVSFFAKGEEFLASLLKMDYTAVFLDIFLGKIDGIETARQVWTHDPQCQIVFLTSSREHIWQAFQVHCFDYIDKKDFTCQRIFQVLSDLQKKLPALQQYLEFTSGNQSIRLPMRKIQYVLSDNNYTIFILEDGTQRRYRVAFGSILELTRQADYFLHCNRGVLLNMNAIVKEEADVYVMKNGQRFPIRRLERASIKNIYHQYQFAKLEEM